MLSSNPNISAVIQTHKWGYFILGNSLLEVADELLHSSRIAYYCPLLIQPRGYIRCNICVFVQGTICPMFTHMFLIPYLPLYLNSYLVISLTNRKYHVIHSLNPANLLLCTLVPRDVQLIININNNKN